MTVKREQTSRFFGMSARNGALCLLFALSVLLFVLLSVLWFLPSFAQAAPQVAEVEVSRTGTEARTPSADFGYRYPMAGEDAFVVIVRDERNVLVYLPASSKTNPSASANNNPTASPSTTVDFAEPQSREDFEALLEALDAKSSGGGVMLNTLEPRYEYTSDRSVTRNGYRYDFAVEVEPGHYYASITSEGNAENNTGALFAETGFFTPVADVVIEEEPTGFAALGQFFSRLDLRPFWVSLRTSAVAMFFVFILGLLAAWYSQRIGNRLKGVLDSLFTIPMVLPPTVCGFILLVLFGNSTPVGRWLLDHGITLIFSWPAAVLAAVVVSFPLMYRTARGAFEGLDPNLADAARTLGWPERRIFLKLMVPLAWPSIAAGTVLAFARAMGEFGATLFVAGNYPGVTQTMPIAIYFEWMGGHSDVATFWVFVVILFSFVVILFVNWYASHTQRYRRASSDKQESLRRGNGAHVDARVQEEARP